MNKQILDRNQWYLFRNQLRNNYDYNDNWRNVIELFRLRIENYYLSPINKIKHPAALKGEGFTILTIQCALIEMFAAFKSGKIHNHRKTAVSPSFEYKQADDCFIKFLQTEAIFENHFYSMRSGRKRLNVPFSAKDFYGSVRCGLMHEARTKGSWVINAKKAYPGGERIFITQDSGTIRVDRNILNNLLTEYLQNYLAELSAQNQNGNSLRRLFGRKLDHFYDIQPDSQNYDWWEDR
ncbi:hypothetical protein SD960_02345 [Flavobacterium sp. MMLR14_040]|uniref:hypothetical protein n=1 Tax=Flavobacterium sp. MMLR14_040 TaxID=3093843 RepID=UPI00298F8229|nr:hypothetical protein [Flavobacterium sp. MMLR14_040]MDW8848918.1 hypothetical protein [Flavobacterium sp. MMLR14_040]